MATFLTRLVLSMGLCSFSLFSLADVKYQAPLTEIKQLYQRLLHHKNLSMDARLALISQYWLHKPYALFALGEGPGAEFDETPRYRSDAFDCETFVDTVLAIALATDVAHFQRCMDTLRYKQGQVTFTTRNHFTSIDWNKNNQQQGLLRDVTRSIKNQDQQSVALLAETDINKANWYAHLPLSRVRLTHSTLKKNQHALQKLHLSGRHFAVERSRLAYIPLKALFDQQGRANLFLFQQIPNAAIIEIVRPNWDLVSNIGTQYDVSHLGFVFWQHGQLIFREASSNAGQIIDIPLIDYLRQQRTSPSIKGINIQVVVPKTPHC